jgi:hypothetical protein
MTVDCSYIAFAHGRGLYQLQYDLGSAKAAIAQAPAGAVVDYAMTIFKTAELEPDELAEFVLTVSKTAKVGVREVTARSKGSR